MSLLLWLALVLPVMAAMLYLYFTARTKPVQLIGKGGATCAALATAVFCHLRGGGLSSGEIIIAAAALFALADVLLNIRFIWGVAAFAAGHVSLIVWLFRQEAALHQPLFTAPVLLIAAALYALAVFLFKGYLKKAGKLTFALLPYAAILSLMTGVSLTLPCLGGVRYLPFALGAGLFMISDLMVARGILIGSPRRFHILTMIVYESAVLLMSLCA